VYYASVCPAHSPFPRAELNSFSCKKLRGSVALCSVCSATRRAARARLLHAVSHLWLLQGNKHRSQPSSAAAASNGGVCRWMLNSLFTRSQMRVIQKQLVHSLPLLKLKLFNIETTILYMQTRYWQILLLECCRLFSKNVMFLVLDEIQYFDHLGSGS
jgi:hypothetical protein